MACISYKKGYKYQLDESYELQIPLQPDECLTSQFIQLDLLGNLTIKQGYAWDGASGPALDIPSLMRASLVHDVLYQLMREKLLDNQVHRCAADLLLKQHCIEDGMWPIVAWVVYKAVRVFGNPSADPSNRKQSVRSPEQCE